MKYRLFLFRVLAMGLPLLLLVLAEGILRLVGVDSGSRHLFQAVPGEQAYQTINPDYMQRYFRGFAPSVAFDPFLREKDDNTFRVFVLGGSTTAGFPYQSYHGFPGRLGSLLQAHAPGQRVEVINMGVTAVNSYTLRDIKGAVLEQQPDAVVIYAGHNEYYGAFGAGTSVYALGNRHWLKRLTLRLKHTVLYTLLERLLVGSPKPATDRTMMARVVRDATIAFEGDVYWLGVRQYENNMRAVLRTFCEANVPVYMGTLTANLRDQTPLGEEKDAMDAYNRGRGLLEESDTLAAREAFLEAKELDDIRFRAPEAINNRIRLLAGEFGVMLVDIQEIFRQASPQGLEGGSLFTDHLHPNARGYGLVAEAFFDVLRHHPLLRTAGDPVGSVIYAVNPVEQAHATLHIARLKGGYPFKKEVSLEEEIEAYRLLIRNYLSSGRWTDSLAAVLVMGDKTPPEVLLEASREGSDTLATLLSYHALLSWQPFNEELLQEAFRYAEGSLQHDDILGNMAQQAVWYTGKLDYLNLLAAIRLRQGSLQAAEILLANVEVRDSTSQVMLFNKARLLLLQGDTTSARGYFERYRSGL